MNGGDGVRIENDRFLRRLCFGDTDVQSAMDLRDPDRLVLEYTRLMMGFLLFQPRPSHILMIGLGGGSLPKFCHRHLPEADITVLEVDPSVLALRDRFEIPPDQPGFRVLLGDGAAHLATVNDASVDVLLVDGFDAGRMAPSLGTQGFYADCRRVLRSGGVMVGNLHELDLQLGIFLDRIGQCFDGHAAYVPARECGNCVVFARREVALSSRLPRHLRRPGAMPEATWAGIEAALHDVLRTVRATRRFP